MNWEGIDNPELVKLIDRHNWEVIEKKKGKYIVTMDYETWINL